MIKRDELLTGGTIHKWWKKMTQPNVAGISTNHQ
jgi:hypothetical protein